MKSDRRHEMQENQLAKGIIKIPTFLERHGNKVFIAVIVASLAVIVINWRTRSARDSLQRATEALAVARSGMADLHNINPFAGPPLQIATARTQLINDIRAALDTASNETDDRAVLADALLAKADLDWQLANLPPLPGATTQPTLRPDVEPAKALDEAFMLYKRVPDEFSDQKLAVIGARFGLAAIAENRGQWDAAKQQYQSLASDTTIPKAFQSQAKFDLEQVNDIQSPAYLATPASRPTELLTPITPTTVPAAPLGPSLITPPHPASTSTTR